MKICSSAILAAICAFATSWLLDATSVLAPPATAQRPEAIAHSTVFSDRASVLVAAAGACNTQADVGPSLMGGAAADTDEGSSTATQDETEAAAAEAVVASTPDSSPAAPVAPPLGGSCGTRHVAETDDAGTAPANEPNTPEHELEAPQPPKQRTEVATSAVIPEPSNEASKAVVAIPPRAKKQKAQRVQPPKEPLTAWWPARKPDGLNVLFVGEAAFGSAISVLTDGHFDKAESANQHIKVRSASGTVISGRWQVSKNPQMLLLVVAPGVYKVSIQPELVDAGGRQAGAASSGLVYVR